MRNNKKDTRVITRNAIEKLIQEAGKESRINGKIQILTGTEVFLVKQVGRAIKNKNIQNMAQARLVTNVLINASIEANRKEINHEGKKLKRQHIYKGWQHLLSESFIIHNELPPICCRHTIINHQHDPVIKKYATPAYV